MRKTLLMAAFAALALTMGFTSCEGDEDNYEMICFINVCTEGQIDDAATVKQGAKWRTPYKSDIRELIDECDWTWTTQGGVTGYMVKSKTNGNSIFLPAAGYRSKNDLYGEEDYVYLWSSNRDSDLPRRAYYSSRSTKGYSINTETRYQGLPIRAVYVE